MSTGSTFLSDPRRQRFLGDGQTIAGAPMRFFTRRNQPGWLSIVPRQDHIECAYAVRTGGRPTLKWLRREPHEPDHQLKAMHKLRRDMAIHQGFRCSTILPRGSYQTFEVPAPKVDTEEWRDALRWVIKDALEFPLEDASIEVMEIPNDGAPAGREAMAFVIAAQRPVIAESVQLFQRCGLRLKVVSVANMAQRNTAALFEEPGRGLAFFAMYRLGGMLTFTRDGAIYATRRFNYTPEDAGDDLEPERRTQQIERICLDLQRALDNFDRQFSHVSVQRMVVSVPPGHTELLAALRLNLSLKVQQVDLRDVMDVSACPELNDPHAQLNWLLSIGMALRLEGSL